MIRKKNLEIQLLLAEALFLTFSEKNGKSVAQWRNPAGQFASPYDSYPNVLKDEAVSDEFEIALDMGKTKEAISSLTSKGVPEDTATKFTSMAQGQRLKQWKEKVPNYDSIANYMDIGQVEVAKDVLEANGMLRGKIEVLFEEWESCTGKREDRPILSATEELIHLYTPSETALDDAKAILELETPEEMLLALLSRGIPFERLEKHGWTDKLKIDTKTIPFRKRDSLPLLVELFESQARERMIKLAKDKGDAEFMDKIRPLPIPQQKAELQKKGYTPQQIRTYIAIDKKIDAIEAYNHVATKKTLDTIKSLIPPDIMEDENQLNKFFEGLEKGMKANNITLGFFGRVAKVLSGEGNERREILEERIRENGFREDDPFYNLAVINAEIGHGLDMIGSFLSTAMLTVETGAVAFGATRALNIILRANNGQLVKEALSLATHADPSKISKITRVPEMLNTASKQPELNVNALGDAIKTTIDPAVKRSIKDTIKTSGTNIESLSNNNTAAAIASFIPPAILGYLNGILTSHLIATSNDKVFKEMRQNFNSEPLSQYISRVQQLVAKHGLQDISFDMEKIAQGNFSELKDFIAQVEAKMEKS